MSSTCRSTQSAIVEGDTALTPDQGTTWGSLTIQVGGVQIRNAAATARAALIEQAAKRLERQAGGTRRGGRRHPRRQRRVSYGELVGGRMFSLKLDHAKPAQFKDPKDYKIVGKSVPRVDIPGQGRRDASPTCNNLRVRGMLHGRVIRPPSVGAKLESVDEGSIKDIAGIVRVVREGNFLGVVAQTEWAAIKAARALKAKWSKWEGLPEQAKLFEHVRATKVFRDEVTGNVGNTGEAMGKEGVKKLAATYDFAIHTHGSMGPSCAVAEFTRRQAHLMVGLAGDPRSAQAARRNVRDAGRERALHLSRRLRLLRPQRPRGRGRGCRLLAKAVGRPVRVQWSRADEHGWDPKGPPTLIDLRAALDDAGNVTAWESEFFIPQQTDKSFMVPLIAGDARGPAGEGRHRAGQHLPELQHPLQVRQHQSGLPSAGDDAVPAVLDQDAGPDAEHLRQRVLPR